MKKFFITTMGILMTMSSIYPQTVRRWTENFDGALSFSAQPSNYWEINTLYSTSGLNSYRGRLPNSYGDSIVLETPFYDLESLLYQYGQMRFRHICKIDPADSLKIEYRINEIGPRGDWQPVPDDAYLGKAANYGHGGFNASSYSQWDANNLHAKPEMNWWKEEVFDLYFASYSEVKFRFIIKRGNVLGTQFSYGWLIDDFRIIADTSNIILPEITLVNPLPDTIHTAGPFDIMAEIQSSSIMDASVEYLKLHHDTASIHSVPMQNVGQNKWQATIPFLAQNTKVIYSVVAEDSMGNKNNTVSSFFISKDISKHYDSNAVSILSLDTPIQHTVTGGVETPIKITIRNEGDYPLTDATVCWSVNGVSGTPYQWSGNLPWSAIENQIEIGTYIPSENKFDTIVIWITDINNRQGRYSDSLTGKFYGCTGPMQGIVPIWQSGSSFAEMIELLNICSVGGDIIFSLENGYYVEDINLSGINLIMGSHHLTITSATGNRDSVILYPVKDPGILLNNSNNITIDKITIDASASQSSAIHFANACSNIVISNCVLLGNTTASSMTSSPAPINKSSGSGVANNIRITNNLIKGGYYGIQFYGGSTGSYGENIVIDSNEFTDQYYYGLYLYYSKLELLHNTVYYNKDGAKRLLNNNWQGISVYSSDGRIIGNRVHQLSQLIYSTGLFISSLNQYQQQPCIISNNEIIMNTSGDNQGVYLSSNTNAIFAHNSVYVSAVERSPRALYVTDNKKNKYTIKNNLLAVNDSAGYAIYLDGIDYSLNYDIDYNNYYVYSPSGNIGYASGSKKTLSDWQQTVKNDIHSMNKQPSFIDSLLHLDLSSSAGLNVPYLPEVLTDMNNKIRSGITTVGAYEYNDTAHDAFLSEFVNWKNNPAMGAKDSVKVILVNGGTTPLTAIEIEWSFNGNAQTAKTWSGSLSKGESDTILLDEITYSLGMNNIKAWIKDFTDDACHPNDTVYAEDYFCDTMFNGTYVIGSSGVFATVEEAMDKMLVCGINGPVVLAMENGIYPTIDLSIYENMPTTAANTITITSLSGNRDSVVINSDTVASGVLLGNINHIIIDGITIDVSSPDIIYGIQFIDACDHIVIANCNIKSDPATVSSSSCPVYKGSSTNSISNLTIKNNTISGGYYGIYLYAGDDGNLRGKGIVIASNTITDSYYAGILCYYADIDELSHNTIISRHSSPVTVSWQAISLYYGSGKINANKIHQISTAITSPTGIYLNAFNINSPAGLGLISNNEIMLTTTGPYDGINVASASVADIIHNSIYIGGLGTGRAISVSDNSLTSLSIKNNNLFVESNNGYPVYLSSASLVSRCDMDYNNYYSPSNVGYVGAAITDIPSWQIAVPGDLHSTGEEPKFINFNAGLQIEAVREFRCPAVAEASDDLEGTARPSITTKGAYHIDAHALDVLPYSFVNLTKISTAGNEIPIEVVFVNGGSDTVTSFNINWTVQNTTKGITWNGSLAYGEQTNIIIDTLTVSDGSNGVKVWTSNPNNGNDMDVFNDTLRESVIACGAPLAAGVYTVGDDMDFSDLEDVQTVLNICGIDGDVTFSIYPATYNTFLNIENISGINDTNSLSFISHTGKAEDVMLRNIVIGADMHKITFKNLTINGQYSNIGIELNTPVKDIVIDGCKIIANPYTTESSTTAPGVYGIYLKGNATDTVRNLQIVNNTIDGGYNGIYIEGGSSIGYEKVTDIWIDGNTMENQSYYSIQLQYANLKSVSHNTILSRTKNTGLYWRGIHLSNVNVSLVNANKIKQRSTSIEYPNGIYLSSVNYSMQDQDAAIISNNEVYIQANSYYYSGIYALSGVNIKVLFNSVFAEGNGSSGFLAANQSDIRLTLKYNNLFAAASSYPVYFVGDAYETSAFDVGYNNYYSSKFVGYASEDCYTIQEWQSEVQYDTTSFSIQPQFVDSSVSLELSDYSNFLCITVPEVKKDIKGNDRIGVTTTGCYTQISPEVNLALEGILDFGAHEMATDKDTVRVILRNGGKTPVTSAAISYKFNGTVVSLPAWTGNLETGESDTLTLGELQYISGLNHLIVWIDSLPGLTDPYQIDDTTKVSRFFCDSAMQGTYTVGTTSSNADFSTLSEAVTVLYRCGIGAPVIFELEDSLYLEHVYLEKPLPGSSAINTVTFTSSSGKAADVTIQRPDDTKKDLAPFMLKNVANIIISNLTLSALSPLTNTYTYAKGIILNDDCDNIEINACTIILPKFGNPTSTSSNYSAINKPVTKNAISNIRILNNTIDGGVYGIYLQGTGTVMMNNIYIANNIIPATDKGGIYLQYGDSITIMNNILQQRNETTISSLQTFQGIYLSTINKVIVSRNKIQAAKGIYGIYLSYINENLSVSDGLIANNEIRMYVSETTLTTARQGINIAANTKTRIYHNSVFMEGTSVGHGLDVVSSTGTNLDIQNNIFGITNQGLGYPVYFAMAADAMRCNFAYNNYYMSTDTVIGYLETPIKTMSEWINNISTDTKSVSVAPFFINTDVNLDLQSNYDIKCPLLPDVSVDIHNNPRTNTTNMGAYHYVALQNDVLLYEILSPLGSVFDTADVMISIRNVGLDTLKNITVYWEVNGVSQPPYTWNGELIPDEISDSVTIGRLLPDKKINELIIWTNNPNGMADENTKNDTLRTVVITCGSALSGTYKIGSSSSTDFQTINEAIKLLYGCGISGPVVFELDTGEFIENINIKGRIPGSSETNTVTFTSSGGHYDSATIRCNASIHEANPTLTLENVANIHFTNLKISGWSPLLEEYSYAIAVELKDGCENIEFSNCYLEIPFFTETVNSVNYSVVSRTQGVGIPISNIRILNNIISGGSYGIYHNGSDMGTQQDNHILIEGNELVNMDKYGVRLGIAENVKVLNNTVTQRPFAGEKQAFFGIYLNSVTGDNIVQANRIKTDYMYDGINLSLSSGLVANNEIMAKNACSYASGMYITATSNGSMRIINNSILIADNDKTVSVYDVRGVYLGYSYNYELKNNHIVTLDSMSVPVYLPSSYNSTQYDLNYNNYYNPHHTGYASGLKISLEDWKATVTSDTCSVSYPPVYDNTGLSLKLEDTTGLRCPMINGVNTDVNGLARYDTTLMGAYTSSSLSVDVAILEIMNIPSLGVTAEKYTPALRIKNCGTTPVSETVVQWSINGTSLPAYTKTWTGTLNHLENTVLTLDSCSAQLGNNDIVAWITSVNTTGADNYQKNDTVSASFHACDSLYSGNYTVGATNGDFASVMGAIAKFKECGVKGDIVLRLERGTYKEAWTLTDWDFMNNYTLTITSFDSHKDSVILQPQGGTENIAITIKNANHITLKHLTIDAATKALKGIEFTGACNDVTIDGCNIFASLVENSYSSYSISGESDGASIKNLSITNNVIDGGYYGISIYAGTSSYNQGNLRIDGNTISNSQSHAISLNYADVAISHNTISNSMNLESALYAISLYNSDGHIDANKIHFKGTAISMFGLFCSSFGTDKHAIVSNNEIIIAATEINVIAEGIYAIFSKMSLFNNSILIKGTVEANTGISINYAGSSSDYIVKNNNIVMQSSDAYPIHVGDATYGSQFDINYNNYFAPKYIGAISTNAYTALAAWQAVVVKDSFSVREAPAFVDTALNLELAVMGELRCPTHNEVLYDITGTEREKYTTMGAYSCYIAKQDLELAEIVSPSNTGDLCSPSYLPVSYKIRNNGLNACDFSKDSLKLYFFITGPLSFDTVVTVSNGVLKEFSTDIFDLTNMLDVSYSGDYLIEAWIATDSFDTVHSNDTLRTTYHNTRIALPFDNDFTAFNLTNLTVENILKDSVWSIVDTNRKTRIKPYYGTGMLLFNGEFGTISRISTGHLELNRTHQPTLEFWYAHDNTSPEMKDQTDVKLSCDGGITYVTLLHIMRYDSAATSPVWKKYMVDLSQYQDSSCVIVSFESYSYGGIQHIDRMSINSSPDISLSEIIIPSFSECDMKGKKFKAVLTNETGQNMDFDKTENHTELAMEISHQGQVISKNVYPLSGLFEGLASDTITDSTTINLTKGTYIIKSYLTNSIDNTPGNDTLTDTLIIDPSLSVSVYPISQPNACLVGESQVWQKIMLVNTGNMDLSDMELSLQIDTGEVNYNLYSIIEETCQGTILAGDSLAYTFQNPYTVPWNIFAYVQITARLSCDSTLINTATRINECVEMKDLYIADIANLPTGKDNTGDAMYVSAILSNRSDHDMFSDANITVAITNSQGIQTETFTETKTIGILETINHAFTNAYTVPSDTVYYLTVYTDNYDIYSHNDTITIKRETNGVNIATAKSVKGFTMSQNVPNPANNTTRINYTLPDAGVALFSLHSISGQLLYSKTIESSAGGNSFELNTNVLSAGVYFYSMEYKGQRLVKRMSIQD